MQIREWAALFLLKTFMIIKHLLALVNTETKIKQSGLKDSVRDW